MSTRLHLWSDTHGVVAKSIHIALFVPVANSRALVHVVTRLDGDTSRNVSLAHSFFVSSHPWLPEPLRPRVVGALFEPIFSLPDNSEPSSSRGCACHVGRFERPMRFASGPCADLYSRNRCPWARFVCRERSQGGVFWPRCWRCKTLGDFARTRRAGDFGRFRPLSPVCPSSRSRRLSFEKREDMAANPARSCSVMESGRRTKRQRLCSG